MTDEIKQLLIQLAKEADELRASKGYIRKTPTKEERDLEEFNNMLNYQEQVIKEEIEKDIPEPEWDVKIGDPIEYFDPNLSYELTGYRPITRDKGLDFDPKLFTVAADTYRKTGRYTSLIPGTFAHRNFWVNEFNKCKKGVTIGRYTLTGENYFFINYYRLLSVLANGTEEVRKEDFPGFLAKQYEYFHYLELCRKAEFDACAFKARGVGASEIAASNMANAYTFHEGAWNIVTAYDEKYVTLTLSKVWEELDFLNTCTDGAFKHLRMKYDTAMLKKASVVDRDGAESGFKSVILGITADSPRKLRGARVYNVIFEEAGSNPVLNSTYILGEALVFVGGSRRVGIRTILGTAGDTGPNLAGLKNAFFNPSDYSILPYRNFYNRMGEETYTGYFIPSYTVWFGTKDQVGFDSRGVTYEDRAKLYFLDKWALITDPSILLLRKAEYCFTPEDAFVLEGSNAFNTEKLAEQLMNIENKLVDLPKTARLKWSLGDDGKIDRTSKPIAEYGLGGLLRIIEPPILDDDGIPYTNLYCIGIDGIDTSADTTTGLTDLSQFCVVVYRRQFGLKDPKIVALYKYRPRLVSDAYDEALKLCLYYNAKALVEATRVGVIEYFKKNNMTYYLMRKPKVISSGKNILQFGAPATTTIIEHNLLLINDYVENFYTQINYLEVIDELTRYSFENKRKFDIVAALGFALLADEELGNRLPRQTTNTENKKVALLGYYKNAYGQIEFGVKPDNTENYGGLMDYGRLRTGY